jgi:tetratricopeptide (TPR) repeat protein
MKSRAITATLLLLTSSALLASSLEKAEALRSNGLIEEAKAELIRVAFDEALPDDKRAEALLLLGDIAVDEGSYDAASENWTRVIQLYPDSEPARLAQEKLDLLTTLVNRADTGDPRTEDEPTTYEQGTILVVSSNSDYPWAAHEIAASLAQPAAVFSGTLEDTFARAKAGDAIRGVVEIHVNVDSAFESVRAVCYSVAGRKEWQKKTSMSWIGSQEQMARRMVSKVAAKIEGLSCP